MYRTKGCRLQLGGSDQWGNITTGTELIRRTEGGEAYALTCPLITKADGKKFGKTESGNIWLDPKRTSPYRFYQFWLNVADDDAEKYIKIFTTLSREEVEGLVEEQKADPGRRPLQHRLAKEITTMVHSAEAYERAVEASKILFDPKAADALRSIDEATLLDITDGVPRHEVEIPAEGVKLIELLTDAAPVFPSKGEMRKMAQQGGLSVNKERVTDQNALITPADLLQGRYLLVTRGKKNHYLLIAR